MKNDTDAKLHTLADVCTTIESVLDLETGKLKRELMRIAQKAESKGEGAGQVLTPFLLKSHFDKSSLTYFTENEGRKAKLNWSFSRLDDFNSIGPQWLQNCATKKSLSHYLGSIATGDFQSVLLSQYVNPKLSLELKHVEAQPSAIEPFLGIHKLFRPYAGRFTDTEDENQNDNICYGVQELIEFRIVNSIPEARLITKNGDVYHGKCYYSRPTLQMNFFRSRRQKDDDGTVGRSLFVFYNGESVSTVMGGSMLRTMNNTERVSATNFIIHPIKNGNEKQLTTKLFLEIDKGDTNRVSNPDGKPLFGKLKLESAISKAICEHLPNPLISDMPDRLSNIFRESINVPTISDIKT